VFDRIGDILIAPKLGEVQRLARPLHRDSLAELIDERAAFEQHIARVVLCEPNVAQLQSRGPDRPWHAHADSLHLI
jgi:hypothetical protein